MPTVVVDTSVWAGYFRTGGSPQSMELRRLLERREVVMVGMVYSELLRGARNESQLVTLENQLNAIPFLEASKETWKRAGRLLAELQQRGSVVPMADAVIAALALEHGHAVFTLDEHFQRIPGLQLHTL